MGVLEMRKAWSKTGGTLTGPPGNSYPLKVASSKVFEVGEPIECGGYRWTVLAVDDAANMLYIRPCGDRKQTRAAIRKAFK